MGKSKHKKKSGQFPSNRKEQPLSQQTKSSNLTVQNSTTKAPHSGNLRIRPEQMSLTAHSHIQTYLRKYKAETHKLSKDEVTAILRLRQHLRVFGLLSAVGFVNQSNQQEGKVSGVTNQVWHLMLNELIDEQKSINPEQLMEAIQAIARSEQAKYMVLWRRSLVLSHYWNFWAKAYQEEKTNDSSADVSDHPTAD